MKIYIKNYAHRAKEILTTVIVIVAALGISAILFGSKLHAISNQLMTYDSANYQYAYSLNYDITADNVYVYPDTDIMLYSDAEGTARIAVSSIMEKENTTYNLLNIPDVSAGSILISQNTADKYHLKPGDKIYAQYPFSKELYELSVQDICGTEYDFSNPSIDNDIGMVYLDFSRDYVESMNCKYLMFSDQSSSELLSEHAQVLSATLSKSNNYNTVLEQGLYILVFEFLFIIIALIIANIVFFRKSAVPLRRMFLKGENKRILVGIPFAEKLFWGLIPMLFAELITKLFIPCNSLITRIYYGLPITIVLLYALISWLVSMIVYRRRR